MGGLRNRGEAARAASDARIAPALRQTKARESNGGLTKSGALSGFRRDAAAERLSRSIRFCYRRALAQAPGGAAGAARLRL